MRRACASQLVPLSVHLRGTQGRTPSWASFCARSTHPRLGSACAHCPLGNRGSERASSDAGRSTFDSRAASRRGLCAPTLPADADADADADAPHPSPDVLTRSDAPLRMENTRLRM
ncbi:hypothetical protein OH76DRAFT_1409374 [Lentinus brumalis]|uniref:Uncharacterized protein n=1 Tax=Lentinus brumalis TaxID=2498619 RepID=A0A371CV26_9APHY|nr:hypothetical protein OH76DRAFT_1409374 [Polyporus brumalis]